MKKRILAIIMAVVLIFVNLPAVIAEAPAETEENGSIGGFLSSLFGEDGALSSLLEEGGLVDELLNGENGLGELLPEELRGGDLLNDLRTQLADSGSELYSALDNLMAFVTNEDGSLNMDAVQMILGSLFGGDESSDGQEGPEDYLGEAGKAALKAYILAANVGGLESSDAQALIMSAPMPKMQEDGCVRVISLCQQQNYHLDGKDLKLAATAVFWILVKFEKNDNGEWQPTEYKVPEAGEGYDASVAALCEEAGYTAEQASSVASLWDLMALMELTAVMQEHPEAEHIELSGKLLTGEEVKALLDAAIRELMSGGMAE